MVQETEGEGFCVSLARAAGGVGGGREGFAGGEDAGRPRAEEEYKVYRFSDGHWNRVYRQWLPHGEVVYGEGGIGKGGRRVAFRVHHDSVGTDEAERAVGSGKKNTRGGLGFGAKSGSARENCKIGKYGTEA